VKPLFDVWARPSNGHLVDGKSRSFAHPLKVRIGSWRECSRDCLDKSAENADMDADARGQSLGSPVRQRLRRVVIGKGLTELQLGSTPR
jgi:hypothetical protein